MSAANPEEPPPKIWPDDPQPRSTFFRWRRRVRLLKEGSAGFDFKWMKALICVLALSTPVWSIPNVTVQSIMPWVLMAASLMMGVYFGHILFFRLQCSLLEFCVIIAALGNLEGMLLTTPGIFSIGKEWVMVLAPLGMAWLFYGAVIGRIQAELSGRRGAPARLFYIVAGWLSTGALSLLGLGAILWFGRHETKFITPDLSAWAIPLLTAGIMGMAFRIWLGMATRRTAKAIMFNS